MRTGRPLLGEQKKKIVSVTLNSEVLEQIRAIEPKFNLSKCVDVFLKVYLETLHQEDIAKTLLRGAVNET